MTSQSPTCGVAAWRPALVDQPANLWRLFSSWVQYLYIIDDGQKMYLYIIDDGQQMYLLVYHWWIWYDHQWSSHFLYVNWHLHIQQFRCQSVAPASQRQCSVARSSAAAMLFFGSSTITVDICRPWNPAFGCYSLLWFLDVSGLLTPSMVVLRGVIRHCYGPHFVGCWSMII